MAKSIKKAVTKGKNIRFSDKGHKLISAFCSKRGYNLGAFCEIAVMDKIRIESTNPRSLMNGEESIST